MTADWQGAAELLARGVEQLEREDSVSHEHQSVMIEFIKLLAKWNRAFNLTSITEWREMVVKHLLDSLAVNPWVTGETVLDVGTGAGIPGVPLAIANPDKQFTLLDSNGKKTRFITQAVTELGIKNIEVVQSRIENFNPDQQFNQIICRAYSSLEKFVDQTKNLLHADVELLAMKGQLPAAEIQRLSNGSLVKVKLKVKQIHELNVPFLDEQRHLITLTLQSD